MGPIGGPSPAAWIAEKHERKWGSNYKAPSAGTTQKPIASGCRQSIPDGRGASGRWDPYSVLSSKPGLPREQQGGPRAASIHSLRCADKMLFFQLAPFTRGKGQYSKRKGDASNTRSKERRHITGLCGFGGKACSLTCRIVARFTATRGSALP